MIRPVGPKGGNEEFPVTKVPPGAGDVSEVAQGRLENAVFKAKEFEAEKKVPNHKEAKIAEKLAFDFFESVNTSAKP